jgi:hypothetical protein
VLKIRAPINPQYLKERALEDIEEAKKNIAVFVEEEPSVVADRNQSTEGYTQTFL